jgi:hypothetical protein
MKPRNFNLKYSFKYISKQQKNLNNDMNLPSRVKHKKRNQNLPFFFLNIFGPPYEHKVVTHDIVSSALYIHAQ